MPSCGMLHRVALAITDVLEECRASIIRMTRIGELGMLAVTSNQPQHLLLYHFTKRVIKLAVIIIVGYHC
jgi:hypothetical protein